MTIWPPEPETLRRPAYRSLIESVMRAIEAGALKPGDRMPTHRNLAYDLGLSVQTVSRAYDELIRRGVISGEVGRGTFVRAARTETRTPYLPDSSYGTLIDCSLLKPVIEDFHTETMRSALRALADDLPMTTIASFRPAVALRKYRESAVKWLRGCGLTLQKQGLLITNGNTAAMTVALMTVASPGDMVVAEEITHHTLKPLARYLGLRLRGLAADGDGLLPEALDRACSRDAVKAVFLMPAGLGPQAITMPAERRASLVEVARRHDIMIVENDAWGPLQPDRLAPIAAMAPERSFYFTSLTKCIMPGLRTGFLVMPETLESSAANRHLVTSWMATPMMAEIAARWIEDGTADRMIAFQSRALDERNRLVAEVFGSIPFSASRSGMHVWLPLPDGWSEENFVSHARQHGVAVAPGSAFAIGERSPQPGVRVCIGAERVGPLTTGLQTLARLVRSKSEPALLTI